MSNQRLSYRSDKRQSPTGTSAGCVRAIVLALILVNGVIIWNRISSRPKFGPQTAPPKTQPGSSSSTGSANLLSFPSNPSTLKQVRVNPVDGAEMVWIPAGTFIMSDRNTLSKTEGEHEVYLDGYWIYRFPVSVAQYRKFCQATSREMPAQPAWGWHDDHPIVNVAWNDAKEYSRWALGDCPDEQSHLATEAQYEHAARGPERLHYPWGNDFDVSKYAHADTTEPVGRYPANSFGLYDLTGNVREWCQDWFATYGAPQEYQITSWNRNPMGVRSGKSKVVRGSIYGGISCGIETMINSFRDYRDPAHKDARLGFRCAGQGT